MDQQHLRHFLANLRAKSASSPPPADVYIIKGNPDVDTANAHNYSKFYDDVASVVQQTGLTPAFDDGLAGTLPPGGKLWIGHSRGADRLRFAPKGVSTIRLDDFGPAAARERQRKAYEQLFLTHGFKNIADVPLHMRPQPGPEHYTLSDTARAAITAKLKALQQEQSIGALRRMLRR